MQNKKLSLFSKVSESGIYNDNTLNTFTYKMEMKSFIKSTIDILQKHNFVLNHQSDNSCEYFFSRGKDEVILQFISSSYMNTSVSIHINSSKRFYHARKIHREVNALLLEIAQKVL